ncbi:MAG TPA: tetratricopeptide repeat protein, partial [Mucilaginibacter sp.]|nr:tetratricopeptide repeat protein [Mucilaginibacter sp.]
IDFAFWYCSASIAFFASSRLCAKTDVPVNINPNPAAAILLIIFIAVNPKSALNFAGLGAVAHVEKDNSTATTDFSSATALAGKKNATPFQYVGLAYLLPVSGSAVGPNGSAVTPADANSAIAVLNQGKAADPRNIGVLIALGDANRSQLKSNDAYEAYSSALAVDPNSPAANVAEGVLWEYADNLDGAVQQFQKALAANPNYGPAYREWAETDLRAAKNDPSQYDAKVKEAADNYKKFISLTDYSPETQMRYADFLIRTKDYVTLQKVAQDLSAAKSNLRVYRYLGYAAFENKDYQTAVTSLTKWTTEADPKRLLPLDFLYLGRAQIELKNDSVAVLNLRKALSLDTNQVDAYGLIADALYKAKKFKEAGDAYHIYAKGSKQAKLLDHYHEGYSYYEAYLADYTKANNDKTKAFKPDSTLLTKADTALSYVEHKLPKPNIGILYIHAQIKDFEDSGDRNNIKGYAKPLYEQLVQLLTALPTPTADQKSQLLDAYVYLGNYAEFKDKDHAKALDYFNKAKEIDPTEARVVYYFQTSGKPSK